MHPVVLTLSPSGLAGLDPAVTLQADPSRRVHEMVCPVTGAFAAVGAHARDAGYRLRKGMVADCGI